MSTQDEDELRQKLEQALHVDWAFGEKHGEIAQELNGNKPDKIIIQGYPKGAYHTSYEKFINEIVEFVASREQSIKQEAEFFMGSHISTLMMPLLVHRLEKDFPSMTKEIIEGVHNKVQDYMKPFMEKREKSLHSTNNSLEEK